MHPRERARGVPEETLPRLADVGIVDWHGAHSRFTFHPLPDAPRPRVSAAWPADALHHGFSKWQSRLEFVQPPVFVLHERHSHSAARHSYG